MSIVELTGPISEDIDLVRRMAKGDEVATRHLIAAHGDALLRFVRRRVGGSFEDAEEVVQDTFIAAAQMGLKFDGLCSTRTWLGAIARVRIANSLRHRNRQKRVPERQLVHIDDNSRRALREVHDTRIALDDLVDRLDRVRIVQALLDAMSPEQREAILMRYVEGFSIADIALMMNRSEKAVERLLERAKERPRKEMLHWLQSDSFQALCFDLLTL